MLICVYTPAYPGIVIVCFRVHSPDGSTGWLMIPRLDEQKQSCNIDENRRHRLVGIECVA